MNPIRTFSDLNRNKDFIYVKCKNCKQKLPDLTFMLEINPKCILCLFIKFKNSHIRNYLKKKIKSIEK